MNGSERLVCVVDDDASVLKSLVRLFRSAGLITEAFESAREYLAKVAYPGPSCLVLDVRMPELNGLDLQRALVASGRDEQVVFITGDGDIPMCARAMKEGAIDFLTKPFEDVEVLSAVERALVRSAEHRRWQAGHRDARLRIASLTPRELQVFEGVIAGQMNKEIASELGTALKTVKAQRGRVMEKMGVASVAELVRIAQNAASGIPDKS